MPRFLLLAGLVAQAYAAAYTGTYYATGGLDSNTCPTGTRTMTTAECNALSAKIVTGNAAAPEYVDYQNLLFAANGAYMGQFAPIGSGELFATAADPSASSSFPGGCFTTQPIMAADYGRVNTNTNAGSRDVTSAKICVLGSSASPPSPPPSPPPPSPPPSPPPFPPLTGGCAHWCNAHTCHAKSAACSGCPICLGVLNYKHCDWYCNVYTCYLAGDYCQGCDVCASLEVNTHCEPWCNSFTCWIPGGYCEGCFSCGGTPVTTSPWATAFHT